MSLYRFAAFSLLAVTQFTAAGGLCGQQPKPPGLAAAFKGHTDTVESVSLSPDGKYLVTASFDHKVRLFDAASGKEIRTYGGEQGHKGQVLCVAFTAKGDQLASGGADNNVRIWDVP